MSIVKYNPFGLSKTFDDFFDSFWNRPISEFVGSDNLLTLPSVNTIENDDSFMMEVAAPGLKKDDFDIKMEDDYLKISAHREEQKEEKGEEGKFMRREFNYTSFERTFYLPETVKREQIEASYEDGVLRIKLPKAEEAKKLPAKTIEIK